MKDTTKIRMSIKL